MIKVYTDGSCLINPGGPGGWAAVILADKCDPVEISGGAPETTNNRMEMTAVIEGLKAVAQAQQVTVFSDSQYVINGFKAGWVNSWKKRGWNKVDTKITVESDLIRYIKSGKQSAMFAKGEPVSG